MIVVVYKMLLVLVLSYLIGSIPTGYIIVKLLKKIDIRTVGSGSTGATNVKRVLGTKWFIIVLVLDVLKGFLPVLFVAHYVNFYSYVDPNTNFYYDLRGLNPVISALALLIGHSKSIFLGFTGGKSVATGVGTILALSPVVGLITGVIWLLITLCTKYVSIGSIVAITLTPIIMRAFGVNDYYVLFAAICAAYVIFRHRENIKRLVEGKENKTEFFKKKNDEAENSDTEKEQ